MARIPPSLVNLLDKTLDANERVIWQARPDAWASMMTLRFLWWIGVPLVALTVFAGRHHWIGDSVGFFLILGAAMLVAPMVLYVNDLQTLFVITDRRALTLSTAWGKTLAKSIRYAQMDREPQALPVKENVGHLTFAPLKRSRNTNSFSGFRCVKDVEKVRALLQQALARQAA